MFFGAKSVWRNAVSTNQSKCIFCHTADTIGVCCDSCMLTAETNNKSGDASFLNPFWMCARCNLVAYTTDYNDGPFECEECSPQHDEQ